MIQAEVWGNASDLVHWPSVVVRGESHGGIETTIVVGGGLPPDLLEGLFGDATFTFDVCGTVYNAVEIIGVEFQEVL